MLLPENSSMFLGLNSHCHRISHSKIVLLLAQPSVSAWVVAHLEFAFTCKRKTPRQLFSAGQTAVQMSWGIWMSEQICIKVQNAVVLWYSVFHVLSCNSRGCLLQGCAFLMHVVPYCGSWSLWWEGAEKPSWDCQLWSVWASSAKALHQPEAHGFSTGGDCVKRWKKWKIYPYLECRKWHWENTCKGRNPSTAGITSARL